MLQTAQAHPHAQKNTQHGASRPTAQHKRQHKGQQQSRATDKAQTPKHLAHARLTPVRHRAWHQHKEQWHHEGRKHQIEIRRPHRQLAHVERINDEWVQGAQQHRASGHHQQDAVEQQERLARDQAHGAAQGHSRCSPCKQGERSAHHHRQKDQNENPARGVRRKSVNRGQYARANQESAQ